MHPEKLQSKDSELRICRRFSLAKTSLKWKRGGGFPIPPFLLFHIQTKREVVIHQNSSIHTNTKEWNFTFYRQFLPYNF